MNNFKASLLNCIEQQGEDQYSQTINYHVYGESPSLTLQTIQGGIGYLGGNLPLTTFAFVIVAGVLFIPIIGGFQLRQDDRLSEKSFLELMKMVIGQLPLIGNMLGNILNPKDKDNE